MGKGSTVTAMFQTILWIFIKGGEMVSGTPRQSQATPGKKKYELMITAGCTELEQKNFALPQSLN